MKKLYATFSVLALAASLSAASAQSTVNYTMGNYTVTPASGSTLKKIETIKVVFNGLADGIDAHILTSNAGNYISITDGTEVWKPTGFYAGVGKASSYDELLLEFPSIGKAGHYTLSIAEGVVKDYDQAESHDEGEGYSVNGPITAEYTITETVMNVYTIDPAPGSTVSELSKFTIVFPNSAKNDGIDEYSSPKNNITLTCGTTVYKPVSSGFNSNYDGATFTFDKITEEGVYTLHIAEGVWKEYDSYSDESVNPAITATYTVSKSSGVEDIAVEAPADDKVTVVDMLGRTVVKNAGCDALKTLEKGLYIVNGEKVAIR